MLPKFKAVFPFKPIEMGLEYCYRKNDFIICPIIIGIHFEGRYTTFLYSRIDRFFSVGLESVIF